MMNKKFGFTLIELLIVVAIIAILAAIAVPNFLEAQTRSKVSRCKADMRTQITALESYYIDNNRYPPAGDIPPVKFNPTDPEFHARMPTYLTTPIAYITSLPLDPFVSAQSTLNDGMYAGTTVGQRYAYFNWQWYLRPADGGSNENGFPDYWNGPIEWTGEWLIYGYGPDRTPFHGAGATFMPYDSTNGTISDGNIIRCQKDNDGIPPHPITGTYLWQ